MDFVVTEEFYSVYEELADDRVVPVDEVIRRLLVDHTSGWARRGRIEGGQGGAWIIPVTGRGFEGAVYWEYLTDDRIVLIALVVRDG